jgi:PAS domain S-box-containing protein
MVHVEKTKIKGNVYYKLVHSVRKDGKVKSKSKYLGKVIPAAEELEKLKKEFYAQVIAARQDEQTLKKSAGEAAAIKPKGKVATNLPVTVGDDLTFATRYLSVIETVRDIIFIMDREGNITFINHMVHEALGYNQTEVLGSPLTNFVTVDSKNSINQYLQSATLFTVIIELEFLSKGNEKKLFSVSFSPSHGNDPFISGVARDITVARKTQLDLDKIKQEGYDMLFNYSPIPTMEQDHSALKEMLNELNLHSSTDVKKYFIINPKAFGEFVALIKISKINPQLLNFFVTDTMEHFVSTYMSKQFCRDSPESFIEEVGAIAEGKSEFTISTFIYSFDGTRHSVNYKFIVPPSFVKNYKKVVVSISDTTPERKMEELIIIKNQALESSASGLILSDLFGKISYANESFYELFNVKRGSAEGERFENFFPSKKLAIRILNAIHKKKKWTGTITVGSKPQHYLKVDGTFVKNTSGEAIGVVLSFSDVTELKTTEQIRLEFTNIAAHELKTPITPLKTFLTMMQDQPKLFGINEQGLKNLEVCLRNVHRLDNLIGDILDISKLEAGGMKFNMEKMNFLKLLKNQVNDFTAIAKEKGLILQAILPEKIPFIVGDKFRLAQVVGNLIKNAIKFTDSGRVLVSAKNLADVIEVSVTDTGAGIKEKDVVKLFTKFFQAEDITTRKTKGSWLGLAISKQIVQAHGGKIWVSSPGRNQGSVFTFSIPINIEPTKSIGSKVEKSEESTLDELKLMVAGDMVRSPKFKDSTKAFLDKQDSPISKGLVKTPISAKTGRQPTPSGKSPVKPKPSGKAGSKVSSKPANKSPTKATVNKLPVKPASKSSS